VTTGNFALTGASQGFVSFTPPADPQIQTWAIGIYDSGNKRRKKRLSDPGRPTPRQLNEEFWASPGRITSNMGLPSETSGAHT